jgi:hypothetical protein
MKWIKSRKSFLLEEEAKIKDVILPRQAERVKERWGEAYLDLEEIEPTDKIKQGKWKIEDEDKIKIFSAFFGVDVAKVYESLGSLPDKFADIVKQSINIDLLERNERTYQGKWKAMFSDFNIKKPSIDQICVLLDPVFRKISVSESTSAEVMIRDENGRPIMGEDNKPQKRKREEGEVFFTSNLTNMNGFLTDYNRLFPDNRVEPSLFESGPIQKLIQLVAEDLNNGQYRYEFNIFQKDMFLSIKHNPKDILNMSISKFYSSCQHLYTGMYSEKVIGNVFDPNSVPAFIIFDTPIYWEDDLISEQLPLCRMMIRNIETFDSNDSPKIYFDRAYPDRVKDIMNVIVAKYTGMVHDETLRNSVSYLFAPDLPEDLKNKIDTPYMDRMNVHLGSYIGVNTKSINLSHGQDWTNLKISPKAKIDEITIETPNVPSELLKLNLNPSWIKFKFMKLNTLEPFKNIKANSIAFDKCKFGMNVLEDIKKNNPDLKKLQLSACDITSLDLSIFGELDELQLIYTAEASELTSIIGSLQLNKLIISGDLVSNPESKKLISSMKGRGIKIEVVGPVI